MFRKNYKQGLVDGLKIHADFDKKQAEGLRYVAETQLGQIQDEVRAGNVVISEAINYITGREIANLYHQNTPLDIKELEEPEKRYLIAALFQLSKDIGEDRTEEQKSYMRTVISTLGIANYETSCDYSAIQNMNDLSAQKSILQVILEFCYLAGSEWNLPQVEIEFLDNFNVNDTIRFETITRVEDICNHLGLQGLAIKYGYVPEEGDEVAVGTESDACLDLPSNVLAAEMNDNATTEIARDACDSLLEMNEEDAIEIIKTFEPGSKIYELGNFIFYNR